MKGAQRLVAEAYGADIARAKKPEERAELAKTLLIDAKDPWIDTTTRYVLLVAAKDLAAAGHDVGTALAAIAELKPYGVDLQAFQLEALTVICKSVDGLDAQCFVDRLDPLIDQAIAADRYDIATQFARLAIAAAAASRQAISINAAASRAQEVKEIESAYQAIKGFLATLAEMPKDPEANLQVGRFYCLTKDAWEKGLPFLALGGDPALEGDPALRKLTDMELGRPTDPRKQADLGDGWWAFADGQTGVARRHIRNRAGHWYMEALPNLAGILKAKVHNRLRESVTTEDRASGRKWIDLYAIATVELKSDGEVKTTDEGIQIGKKDSRLETVDDVPVPFSAEFIAKTDSTNIRICYHKLRFILNWERNKSELRFDDDALKNGHGFPGRGKVPENQWVRIEMVVTDSAAELFVDGRLRGRIAHRNYHGARGKLAIVNAAGSVVTVRGFRVTADRADDAGQRADPSPAGLGTQPAADMVPGMIGTAEVLGKHTGILFRYRPGMVFENATAREALTRAGYGTKGIRIVLNGTMDVPQDTTVLFWQRGGSSSGGVLRLHLDSAELGSVGDDRAKNSVYRTMVKAGSHAVRWTLTGGFLGDSLLKAVAEDGLKELPILCRATDWQKPEAKLVVDNFHAGPPGEIFKVPD